MRPIEVVVCWDQISGYMAACWRALSSMPGIRLHVLARQSGAAGMNAEFDDKVMSGISCRLLSVNEHEDDALIARLVIERRPDIVVVPGWYIGPYRRLLSNPSLAGAKMIMAMDTPRKYTWRQWFGRYQFRQYLRRISCLVVAGERSWQLARYLGVPENKILRGVYGIDYAAFAPAYQRRMESPDGWPRRFLFMGRYAPEKGLTSLLNAYQLYRDSVSEPWTLSCCGKGPLSSLLHGATGVEDRGFIQPADQPAVWAEHGALILPSRYEPWGQVIVEACASGLPVICTEACGASVELVRSSFNGTVVPTDDTGALSRAMIKLHSRASELPEMGRRSQVFAAAYGADVWAGRWHERLHASMA